MIRPTSVRAVTGGVVLVGLLGAACLALWRVPWTPVPGGMPPPAPVSDVFTAEQVATGESWGAFGRLWSSVGLALSLAVSSVLGFSPVGRRLMTRLPGPWWVRSVLGVLILALAGRLVTLPVSVVVQRGRLERGLSTQGWSGWVRDLAVSEGVSTVLTAVALTGLLATARRWSTWWPAIAGAVAAGFVVLGSFAYPMAIEPLFNRFESMPDGALRNEIMAVARREDVPLDDVLIADASRRTTTLNAYVSGIGASRRVVVYDTLIDSLPEDEALSVVAHELAHAKYGDVWTGTALGAFAAFAGVGAIGLLLTRRSHPIDARTVPLVLALIAWANVLGAPAQNAVSRRIETRADVVALETTGKPRAMVEMQRTLATRASSDPTPPALWQWWWGSHPTTLQRVALAERSAAGH